jgi:hypothetical protein
MSDTSLGTDALHEETGWSSKRSSIQKEKSMVDVLVDAGQAIWRFICGRTLWLRDRRDAVPRNLDSLEARFRKWASMKGRDTW